MPVGTQATVKAVPQDYLISEDINAQIILGNTYHLYLRPGMNVLETAGGLHRFINWNRPILTDSGGYQVYSLADRRKITEEGVKFSSHIDGSKHLFTPESVIDIQRQIGADIIMAFDECPPYPSTEKYVRTSMELTHRWLSRCFDHFDKSPELYGYQQHLTPIMQGGCFPEWRILSAEEISKYDAEINAIGGLSVGEPEPLIYEMTELSCDHLPVEKARYLMGVGTPANILECIYRGVDLFDCVLPTRNARHGKLYTWNGEIQIKNAVWKEDHSAIDEDSRSSLSRNHSKAYLRHLFMAKEHYGATIASVHNLAFFLELVQRSREEILAGNFVNWKERVIPKITSSYIP